MNTETMENGTRKFEIHRAEDFGLFFNCLTRRYLWDFDDDLLNLIIRILDQYLPYFSKRTLICSIRDLANEKDGIFSQCPEGKPKDQEERYNLVLMQLIRRYLTIECCGLTDGRLKIMKIRSLASFGELSEYYRQKKYWMFPSADDFEQWVLKNGLDKSDGMPTQTATGEILPINADDLKDFCDLCFSCVQYSYGRMSYMPSTCREFIRENIALLSDDGIERIVNEIGFRMKKDSTCNDSAINREMGAWIAYCEELRMELIVRAKQKKRDDLRFC